MRRWMRLIMLLGGMVCAVLVAATPPPGHFSDELDTGSYDCQLTLLPKAPLADLGTLRVLLEWADAQNYTAVTFSATTLTIAGVAHGQATTCGTFANAVQPGAPLTLTIARRADRLLVLRRERRPLSDDGAARLRRGGRPGSRRGVERDPRGHSTAGTRRLLR